MDDERLEEMLRRAPLARMPAGERAELIRRGSACVRRRRVGQLVMRGLALAATLLVAINLAFGRVHESRLTAIMGSQPVVRYAPEAYARALQQQRALAESLGLVPDDGVRGEDHDEGRTPDARGLGPTDEWMGA